MSKFLVGTWAIVLILCVIQYNPTEAAILCVNPGGTGGCYSSIQTAINAAGPGDTINVAAGTYAESLTVNKWLIIDGAGSGSNPGVDTIITPGSGNNLNITVGGTSTTNRLLIQDMRFQGSGGRGLNFGASPIEHVTLLNLIFSGYGSNGINTNKTVNDLEIRDCTFTTSALSANNRFEVKDNVNMNGFRIINSNFMGPGIPSTTEAGLYLFPRPGTISNLEITGGSFTGNDWGAGGNLILLGNINGATITNVTVGNSRLGGIGLYAIGSINNVTITNPTIQNETQSGGIYIYAESTGSVSNVTIRGGNISNSCYGIGVYTGTNITIDGVTLLNNTLTDPSCTRGYGLMVLGGSNINATWNDMRGNLAGIYISGGSLTASRNTITSNTVAGMRIAGGTLNAFCNWIYTNASGATQTAGTATAENNWWGCAAGPGNPGCDGVSGVVDFTPWAASPATITLTANPTSIPADGTSTSSIQALVTDLCGSPMPDGTPVSWSTSDGAINPSTSTTAGGSAGTTLTSSTTPNVAQVTASTVVAGQTIIANTPVTFLKGLSPFRKKPSYKSLISMRPTAVNHITEANSLLTQMNDLLTQVKNKDKKDCEKIADEARELLQRAQQSLPNPIYANNLALQAIGKLKQAIDCLKTLLG